VTMIRRFVENHRHPSFFEGRYGDGRLRMGECGAANFVRVISWRTRFASCYDGRPGTFRRDPSVFREADVESAGVTRIFGRMLPEFPGGAGWPTTPVDAPMRRQKGPLY